MARNNDVLFMSEYIKNVLYFATVKPGKVFKSTAETHFFCVDDELVYENYYSDFGPLNLGCIYKYCRILNEKLEKCLNNQIIVHYTSFEYKKRTNAAFLLGCFGVLYLSLPPKEALKPLIIPGHSYRPFQDATPFDSAYTISILDCLQAINKTKDIGFFNFQDFNYEEYDRLDRLQGGDLNWIVPGKFLAFIGPVENRSVLYHRPEEYIDYFKENNVRSVIRLNKRLYDGNVFNNAGIAHYDLYFPDGSCPPRNILLKFLQISETSDGAIAVHCKAGLGRTGSLIGCYLIKHYRMTSHEAIGWMRICRPGSVIGQQQEWLEQLESWLIKQGNLYRRRKFREVDKLPVHEYGLYSIKEKSSKQRPVLFNNPPSPPLPMRRQHCNETVPQTRPQVLKTRRGEYNENENEERFLASCDLTVTTSVPMGCMKGCIIKNSTVLEDSEHLANIDLQSDDLNRTKWRQIFFCCSCPSICNDIVWRLSVRCVKYAPKFCNGTNEWCFVLDKVASMLFNEKEECNWRIKSPDKNSCQRNAKAELRHQMNVVHHKGGNVVVVCFRVTQRDQDECKSRRSSASGDPRQARWSPKDYTITPICKRNCPNFDDLFKISCGYTPIPTFCTTQGPIVKTINEAKALLMRSSAYKDSQERQNNSNTLSPKSLYKNQNLHHEYVGFGKVSTNVTSNCADGKEKSLCRRRLGRSPSPSPHRTRPVAEQSRATNTPLHNERILKRDSSRTAIRDALSRLKLAVPRYSQGAGSVGAASLGARRAAPAPKRAPSVRSDERPTATQGDMLNSIKLHRRYREALNNEKGNSASRNVPESSSKEKNVGGASRTFHPRPNSPKPRRSLQTPFY